MSELEQAVRGVLFENDATRALALEAVANYEAASAVVERVQGEPPCDDDKAAARWHAQALACCRGRPRRGKELDNEEDRMRAALAGDPLL